MSKEKKPGLRRGKFSDEEKRKIERLADLHTFADIGRQLNRCPHAVRRYCQRNGITKDLPSARKTVEHKAKNNHHFKELQEQLTRDEYDFAVQTYMGLMAQFGNDVIYSEEIQIIEYCMVTCLLNRTFKKEMEINQLIKDSIKLRSELEEKKDRVITKRLMGGDDESDDSISKTFSEEDEFLNRIEEVDIRIAGFNEENRANKKHQIDFLDRKEKVTKALNVSREQRAEELTKVNQNLADLIIKLKKDHNFRKQVGLDIEKMRIGIKEEYIRLSNLHLFANGEEDHPVYNSEVAERFSKENKS